MKHLGLRAAVAALPIVLASCASVPRASQEADAEGKRFAAPSAGQAALYVYRGGALGRGVVFSIAAADRQLGALAAGTWLRRDLEPGQYDVRCTGGENSASTIVALTAGETRFVGVTAGIGWAAPRCALAEVAAAEGRAGVLARSRILEPTAMPASRPVSATAAPTAPTAPMAPTASTAPTAPTVPTLPIAAAVPEPAASADPAMSLAGDPRQEAIRAGEAYQRGDTAEALRLLKVQAEQGQAYAQLKLGDFYNHGIGVAPDKWEAVKWYRRAADQGHPVAQFSLGWMYLPGARGGIPPSLPDAVRWIRQSAERGHARAQVLMGHFHLKGIGVPQDTVQGMTWLHKATDQGDGFAQYYLGAIYLNGLHLPKDYRLGLQWSRKAAERGVALAQFNLGDIYLYGLGVPVDLEQARRWYAQAAAQGFARAKVRLAQPPFG
jgi:TPR repeat protein